MKSKLGRIIGLLQSLFLVISGCSSQKAQVDNSDSEAKKNESAQTNEIQNETIVNNNTVPEQISEEVKMNDDGMLIINGKAVGGKYNLSIARAKRLESGSEMSLELIYEGQNTKWEAQRKGDSVIINELEAVNADKDFYFIEPGHLVLKLKAVKPGETIFSFYDRKVTSEGSAAEAGFDLKVVADENNNIKEASYYMVAPLPVPVAVRPAEDNTNIKIDDSEWVFKQFKHMNGSYKYAKNILVLSVKENLSTGFSWSYSIEGNAIKTISDEHEGAKTKEISCGAPGMRNFIFKGAGEGVTNISFVNRRPWEPDDGQVDLIMTITTDQSGNVIEVNSPTDRP